MPLWGGRTPLWGGREARSPRWGSSMDWGLVQGFRFAPPLAIDGCPFGAAGRPFGAAEKHDRPVGAHRWIGVWSRGSASLHPWLLTDAPLGRQDAPLGRQ